MLRLKSVFAAIAMLVCVNIWADAQATVKFVGVNWENYNTDGTSYAESYNTACNVSMPDATYPANQWISVCFPFDAGAAAFDGVFGEGCYEFREFTSMSGNAFVFTKMENISVVAGTPYLFKCTSTVNAPTFQNVTFKAKTRDDEKSVVIGNGTFKANLFKLDSYKVQNLFVAENSELVDYSGKDILSAVAYFSITSGTPALSIDGETSSGGEGQGGESGGGGEGGGEITPSTTTAAIIARRGQITNLPTVYINIYEAEHNAKDKIVSTENAETGEVTYVVTNNDGTTTEVSNERLAADAGILSNGKVKDIRTEAKSEVYELARITVVDKNADLTKALKERDEFTTIRGRGNSTWNCAKKPYRLKFPSKTKLLATQDGQNAYADAKSWTLLANASDKTMIRNALAQEAARFIGLPFCPAARFVDLVYNGVYVGTYQISDQLSVEKKNARVPVDADTGWFAELTINKFKEDPCYETHKDVDRKQGTGIYAVIKNPEVDGDDINDTTFDPIKEWLDGMSMELEKYQLDLSVDGYKKYIDLESLTDYYLGVELTGNFDAWISNYVYKNADESEKLKWGPMWDYDLAFGNYSDLAATMTYDVNNSNGSFLNSYIKKIFTTDVEAAQLLISKWEALKTKTLDGYTGIEAFLKGKADELASLIEQSRILNYTPVANGGAGWALDTSELAGVSTNQSGNYDTDISNIKTFIQSHISTMNTTYGGLISDMTNTEPFNLDASAYSNDKSLYDWYGKISTYNVKNRTFTANKWDAICLPVEIKADQLKQVFGDDVMLYEYVSLYNTNEMVFESKADLTIEAGVPYLIKPSKTVTDPSFTAVFHGDAYNPSTVEYDGFKFVGKFYKSDFYTGTTIFTVNGNGEAQQNDGPVSIVGINAYITTPGNVVPVIVIGTQEIMIPDVTFNPATPDAVEQTLTPNDGKTVNITIQGRSSFWLNDWNTLCLPFDVSAEKLAELFGEGYTLLKFDHMNNTSFVFEHAEYVRAGVAYMLKPVTRVPDMTQGLVFQGVTLHKSTSPTIVNGYAFVGVLENYEMKTDGTELFLGDNKKLWSPAEGTNKLMGTKAFFRIPAQQSAKQFFFADEDLGVATAIGRIDELMDERKVYNLNGQQMQVDSDALPHGIYIVNGRKFAK